MGIQNKTMLITYSDSLGKNLKDLNKILISISGRQLVVSIYCHSFRQLVTVVLPLSIMMR